MLFPEPLLPTNPILCPAKTLKLILFRTIGLLGVYLKDKLSTRIEPFILGNVIAFSLVISIGLLSISPSLSTPNNTCWNSFHKFTSLITGAVNWLANI